MNPRPKEARQLEATDFYFDITRMGRTSHTSLDCLMLAFFLIATRVRPLVGDLLFSELLSSLALVRGELSPGLVVCT